MGEDEDFLENDIEDPDDEIDLEDEEDAYDDGP
jgi:hypothetical protein